MMSAELILTCITDELSLRLEALSQTGCLLSVYSVSEWKEIHSLSTCLWRPYRVPHEAGTRLMVQMPHIPVTGDRQRANRCSGLCTVHPKVMHTPENHLTVLHLFIHATNAH